MHACQCGGEVRETVIGVESEFSGNEASSGKGESGMVWKDDAELIWCMLNTQFNGVCRFEIVVVGVDYWPRACVCLPILTTGQDFLHSCLHFLGLHLSELTMAIRVRSSDMMDE